jgi:ribosomal peptide maturation radical SAM protein 1
MKVALVSMPFNSMINPSLQLGLLKGVLNQHGIAADTFHLNIELAHIMGYKAYEVTASPVIPTIGEWLASYALFGDLGSEHDFLAEPGWKETFDHVNAELGWTAEDYIRVRRTQIPQFLDWCMTSIPWHEYQIVGFSTTFQQTIISLALARLIKEAHPQIQIVFGGANVLEPMGREHIRAWPWIDHICLGEGDHTFPELVKKIAAGSLGDGVRGFLSRDGDRILDPGPAPMFMNMDSLPDPEYDEYFARIRRIGFDYSKLFPGTITALPMETARGCWWGAKHHCTFCGLPALGMKFRSRSVSNVLAQLDRLSRRYGVWNFAPVDNIIDPHYIKELFGAMAEQGYDYMLWYEAKANLQPDQLRILRNGGLAFIQPGIESLSSHVLRLMDKGVTGLVNINTLKWARYYGLSVQWNLLAGFPGETPADYEKMLDTMKKIVHLEPAGYCNRIWLQRFSPYFEHPERYPISNQRPYRFYQYIYPSDRVDFSKIAYWFEYEMANTIDDSVLEPLKAVLADWRQRWVTRRPDLFYQKGFGRLRITDWRGKGDPVIFEISGDAMTIFEFCQEKPRNLRSICEHVGETEARVRIVLKSLLDSGIMLEEEGDYLSIALPFHHNTEPHPLTVKSTRATPTPQPSLQSTNA